MLSLYAELQLPHLRRYRIHHQLLTIVPKDQLINIINILTRIRCWNGKRIPQLLRIRQLLSRSTSCYLFLILVLLHCHHFFLSYLLISLPLDQLAGIHTYRTHLSSITFKRLILFSFWIVTKLGLRIILIGQHIFNFVFEVLTLNQLLILAVEVFVIYLFQKTLFFWLLCLSFTLLLLSIFDFTLYFQHVLLSFSDFILQHHLWALVDFIIFVAFSYVAIFQTNIL